MPDPRLNARGLYYPADALLYDRDDDVVLVAASGSEGGLGKITTIPASGNLIIRADCDDRAVACVDWQVKIDKAWTYQLFRARRNVTAGTLTLADATGVDDEDTFVLNGETWTCEATEVEATPATRQYYIGADNAAAAVNLTALLNDADYGLPGCTAQVQAVDATDVISVRATTAPVLQFGQGTSAANEIAWAETTLANLVAQAAVSASQALNNTTDGTTIRQAVEGWPYAYLVLTNGDGAAAATPVVRLVRY